MRPTDWLAPRLKNLFEAALSDELAMASTTLQNEQAVWEEKFHINHPSNMLLNTVLQYTELAHWTKLYLPDQPSAGCFVAGARSPFKNHPDRPLLTQAHGYFVIDGGTDFPAYLRLVGVCNQRLIALSYNLGAKVPVDPNLSGCPLVMVSITGKYKPFAQSDYVRGRASINPKVLSPVPTVVDVVDAVACPFASVDHNFGPQTPTYALSFVRADVNALYGDDNDHALRPVGGRLTEPPQFYSEQRGRFDFISFANESGQSYRAMLPSLLICK